MICTTGCAESRSRSGHFPSVGRTSRYWQRTSPERTHRASIPIRDGFLNKWHASIPVGPQAIEVDGVCTVQLRNGLIYSNEVFFDRSELLTAISAARESG